MTKNEKLIILRSVISGFCVGGRPFTSVEVANHLKRLGVWIRNRNVARYLRDNALSIAEEYGGDYRMTPISVDGASIGGVSYQTTTCYHLASFHVGDYLQRDMKAITPEQFEAFHGISPFEKKESKADSPEMCVTKSGGIKFNFPKPD